MAYQKMVSTDTATTDAIAPGGTSTVELSTLCNDLHTTAAPPGKGEAGYGAPYTVGPASPDIVKVLDALTDLGETGMLHNDVLGMELSPYVETLGQVELWMKAGENAGQPYNWEAIAAALSAKLATSLGRQPTEKEMQTAMQPIKVDISSLRIKQQPGAAQEHLKLLGSELAEQVLEAAGENPPAGSKPLAAVCACNRIIIPCGGPMYAA